MTNTKEKHMKFNDNGLKGVAKIHAQANKSDPFSYGRCLHHLRKGYDDPMQVFEEASNILTARGEAMK